MCRTIRSFQQEQLEHFIFIDAYRLNGLPGNESLLLHMK